jgi:hypothetical protein
VKVAIVNRRELLHRGGGLTTIAALSGCLGNASRSALANRGTTATDDPSTTTEGGDDSDDGTDGKSDGGDGDESEDGFDDEFAGVRSDYEEPFLELDVGSRDGVASPDDNRPHAVRIWNAADEARDLLVRVSHGATALIDRTVAFPADGYLTVTLNEPGDYRVAVGLAGEVPTTVAVERTWFDCNASATEVGVATAGSVATTTKSTLLGCHGPEIAGTDFSVGQGGCGTENSASVEWAGEQVRVEGTARTPTPQSDLSLADAIYDQQASALTVRVLATNPDDPEPGTHCVGAVPYETSVDFEYDLPDEVVVVHETADGAKEVARAARFE